MALPIDDNLARRFERLLKGFDPGPSIADGWEGRTLGELRAAATDLAGRVGERLRAIDELARRLKVERSLGDLLIPLFDDPNPAVAEAAMRHAPAFDDRTLARLRQLVGVGDQARRSRALRALAVRKDPSILPAVLEQVETGTRGERAAGVSHLFFLLRPDEVVDILDDLLARLPADADDREMIRTFRDMARERAEGLGFAGEEA